MNHRLNDAIKQTPRVPNGMKGKKKARIERAKAREMRSEADRRATAGARERKRNKW